MFCRAGSSIKQLNMFSESKNTCIASLIALAAILLLCACQDSKIGESLAPLELSVEMKGEETPNITGFFNVSIFAKKESNALKWKLVIEPTYGYSKKLSEELAKSESSSAFSPDYVCTTSRRATFYIKFLDKDGFVLHEAKAGGYSRVTVDEKKILSEEINGSEPVFSREDYKGQISYFGSIDSDVAKIGKIDKVSIACVVTKEMNDIFNALIEAKKEKISTEK